MRDEQRQPKPRRLTDPNFRGQPVDQEDGESIRTARRLGNHRDVNQARTWPWSRRFVESASYEQRIQELDHRQDEVLERLAELDRQIEVLIEMWSPKREERVSTSEPSSAETVAPLDSAQEPPATVPRAA